MGSRHRDGLNSQRGAREQWCHPGHNSKVLFRVSILRQFQYFSLGANSSEITIRTDVATRTLSAIGAPVGCAVGASDGGTTRGGPGDTGLLPAPCGLLKPLIYAKLGLGEMVRSEPFRPKEVRNPNCPPVPRQREDRGPSRTAPPPEPSLPGTPGIPGRPARPEGLGRGVGTPRQAACSW